MQKNNKKITSDFFSMVGKALVSFLKNILKIMWKLIIYLSKVFDDLIKEDEVVKKNVKRKGNKNKNTK